MQQTRLQCNRVWLQTCTCTLRHLHAQTLARSDTCTLSTCTLRHLHAQTLARSALARSDTCTLRHLHAQHLHAQTLARSDTCTLSTCMLRHLHAQTLARSALARSDTCTLRHLHAQILIYWLFFVWISQHFQNSSQVVKTRKKLIKCHLQSLLALSATCDVTCIQTYSVLQIICRRKILDPQICGYRTAGHCLLWY